VSKGSGSGMTRGDRRRNARRERLRELVPRDGVVIGIDLAEGKQALAVVDHDLRVLARRTVMVKAFRLGPVLDELAGVARARGFARVTVACEPTGSRWLQVQRLCEERGLAMVCIQPLVSYIARAQQDLTPHKTDEADCVLIARLAIELHCYLPEVLEEDWAYLRQLGRRRLALVKAASASVLRARDFLSVAWPVAAEACKDPFGSVTWLAGVHAAVSHPGGPDGLAGDGLAGLAAVVREAVAGWGGKRPSGPVLRAVYAALADTEGVVFSRRRGLLRRCARELEDLQRIRAGLRETEAEMITVLGGLGLARLADIRGLSAAGAAAILAESGDPARFETSSSLVKHAGLAPADNESGQFAGAAKISRRGQPALRLVTWRAILPLIAHNPVMAAKYTAMTAQADAAARAAAGGPPGRARAAAAAARAARARARVACAAALLRWIWTLTVRGTCFDEQIASGQLSPRHASAA
jgi:transposase